MKNYQILQEALDKATQRGSFNLQETSLITQALVQTRQELESIPKLQEQLEAYKAEAETNKQPKK